MGNEEKIVKGPFEIRKIMGDNQYRADSFKSKTRVNFFGKSLRGMDHAYFRASRCIAREGLDWESQDLSRPRVGITRFQPNKYKSRRTVTR